MSLKHQWWGELPGIEQDGRWFGRYCRCRPRCTRQMAEMPEARLYGTGKHAEYVSVMLPEPDIFGHFATGPGAFRKSATHSAGETRRRPSRPPARYLWNISLRGICSIAAAIRFLSAKNSCTTGGNKLCTAFSSPRALRMAWRPIQVQLRYGAPALGIAHWIFLEQVEMFAQETSG